MNCLPPVRDHTVEGGPVPSAPLDPPCPSQHLAHSKCSERTCPLNECHLLCLCATLRHSQVRLFVTPWTVTARLLCPRGFSRQEYWSGLPCPPPGNLPNSGIVAGSPTLQVDSLPSEPPGKPKNTGVGILSKGSSRPRNRTRLSCIAGGFFTS